MNVSVKSKIEVILSNFKSDAILRKLPNGVNNSPERAPTKADN